MNANGSDTAAWAVAHADGTSLAEHEQATDSKKFTVEIEVTREAVDRPDFVAVVRAEIEDRLAELGHDILVWAEQVRAS